MGLCGLRPGNTVVLRTQFEEIYEPMSFPTTLASRADTGWLQGA